MIPSQDVKGAAPYGMRFNNKPPPRGSEPAVCTRGYKFRAGSAGWLMYAGAGPVLQTYDLVLDLQLATFQFRDLHLIARRVSEGVIDLLFEGLVPTFQFRKMRFEGHVQRLLGRIAANDVILHHIHRKVDAGMRCAVQKIPQFLPPRPSTACRRRQKNNNNHCLGGAPDGRAC